MGADKLGALDAEEMPWLRLRSVQRLRTRSSRYSILTAIFASVFAILAGLELVETDITPFEVGMSVTLIVATATIVAFVVTGRRLRPWVGMALVMIHALVAVYYVGFSDEGQNAIGSVQQVPIIATYVAWLYQAKIARRVETAVLAAVVVSMVVGPFGMVQGKFVLFGPVNLIGVVLFTAICLELAVYLRFRMQSEANTDLLTGALNRRGFEYRARSEFRHAARSGEALSIAVLDLDQFKAVNDEGGHAAGDDVLRTLVHQWHGLIRERDAVGRLGGDEFAIVMPGTTLAQGETMLRRLRALAVHPWSWGVAEARSGDSVDALLRRADAAMYREKHD